MTCYNVFNKFLKLFKEEPLIEEKMPSPINEDVANLQRQLDDKTEELKRKEETIELLKQEVEEKQAQITHLKNEIDKFRQVIRPITRKIISKEICLRDDYWPGPGMENTRVISVREPRMKRQAISAEPLMNDEDVMQIMKIPKTSK